jgi:hypothetical protein
MPERKDEAYSRKSFERWLSVKYPNSVQEWRYEPDGQRIPDYRLSLGDREIAVEVTRVSMPETSAVYSIHALCEECQEEAKSRGILHGTYVLVYDLPTPDFRFHRREMKMKALEYIAASSVQETTPASTLLENDEREVLSIRKLRSDEDMICTAVSLDSKSEAQEALVLDATIRSAVARKLERFGQVNEPAPKVLLLGHDYPPYDIEAYRRCISTMAAEGKLQDLAAVFLAFSDERGDVLYESAGCFPPRT